MARPAQSALAPFRALATPLADMLRPMPYAGMYPPEDGYYHPIAVSRTMFIDHVDREVAQLMLDRLDARMRTSDAQMVAVQLRVLGGAMARVPVDATAFAHRAQPHHGQRGDHLRLDGRRSVSHRLGARRWPRSCTRATTARTSTS